MNKPLPTYAHVINADSNYQSGLVLDGAVTPAVNGLLVKDAFRVTELDLRDYEVPLIVRAEFFYAKKIKISHFSVDGWHQCANHFYVEELEISVPLDLLDDYKKHPDKIKHPDAVQFIPLDALGDPDETGTISHGYIKKITIVANNDRATKERGCQGVGSFNGTLKDVCLGENGIHIETDVEEHGISIVHAIDCVIGSETAPCKIFSPSGLYKPGIVISDRKHDRVSSGTQLINIEAPFFDISGDADCMTDGCQIPIEKKDMSENKTVQPRQPRGVRNCNPGNIESNPANKWFGLADRRTMTPEQKMESRFCVFETAVYGLRALAILLLNYQGQHKLKSIDAIINRYAPRQDNNATDAYVRAVAGRIGVAPKETVSLKDYATLYGVIVAIIEHENGIQNPYTEDVIREALAMSGVNMPGEVKVQRKLGKSREITRGGAVLGGSTGLAVTEAVRRSSDVPPTAQERIENELVSPNLWDSLSGLEVFQVVLLAVIAFAAVDWMLDRRLTAALGLR